MPYFAYFVQINIIKHFYAISRLSALLQSLRESWDRTVHLRALTGRFEEGKVLPVTIFTYFQVIIPNKTLNKI